uniref:hypothetical protein n=1 Tax=Streptomyces hawaiiensis TaxID=67305 RepID=UPI0031D4C862
MIRHSARLARSVSLLSAVSCLAFAAVTASATTAAASVSSTGATTPARTPAGIATNGLNSSLQLLAGAEVPRPV